MVAPFLALTQRIPRLKRDHGQSGRKAQCCGGPTGLSVFVERCCFGRCQSRGEGLEDRRLWVRARLGCESFKIMLHYETLKIRADDLQEASSTDCHGFLVDRITDSVVFVWIYTTVQ